MNVRRSLLLGPILLAFAGCGEPPSLVPVAPPGLEFQRNIPIPEDQQPQALGEAPSAKNESGELVAMSTNATELLIETEPGEVKTTKSGLKYETLKKGSGDVATAGRVLNVHYVGTLENGTKFDSSRDRREEYPVLLGARKVIQGWDEGLAGMKVGEIRKLTVPAELGYGAAGSAPKIPPNATLIFEIELMKVK